MVGVPRQPREHCAKLDALLTVLSQNKMARKTSLAASI
jgi:hypothetical protein